MSPQHPTISSADNDILIDQGGRRLIDLFSANGTVFLGHCNQRVASAIASQLQKVWITGGLGSEAIASATVAVESYFPPTHRLAGIYSTGMEAAEFALRVARVASGRNRVVGFARNMHGKSLAMAYLGWDNGDGVELPQLLRLPSIPDLAEDQILERLSHILKTGDVGVVFVEPFQGSGGGYIASPGYLNTLIELCNAHGSLVVFDEILTGFHRTGVPFIFSRLSRMPDVVLIGKAIGNGFPASGVVVRRDIKIVGSMLPGSTFAGNALAGAAISATLQHMRELDIPRLVGSIQRIIVQTLGDLASFGYRLRGVGAMWVIEMPDGIAPAKVAAEIYRRGAMVNYAGRYLRVLPPATITPENLMQSCALVRQTLIEAVHA